MEIDLSFLGLHGHFEQIPKSVFGNSAPDRRNVNAVKNLEHRQCVKSGISYHGFIQLMIVVNVCKQMCIGLSTVGFRLPTHWAGPSKILPAQPSNIPAPSIKL